MLKWLGERRKQKHIGQFLSEGLVVILSRCQVEGRVNGEESTVHFTKHE